MLSFIAALVIILYTKTAHQGTHFASAHAIMGLVTYIILVMQAGMGMLMFYVPGAFGTVEKARSWYKYHRISGYLVLVLGMATVCAASWTEYSEGVLGIQHWAVIVASVVTLAGLLARVKKHKLGL